MTLIPAVAPRTSATAPTAARSPRFTSAVLLAHAGRELARRLLVAERLDRIETRGLPCWIESEEDPDGGGEPGGTPRRWRPGGRSCRARPGPGSRALPSDCAVGSHRPGRARADGAA